LLVRSLRASLWRLIALLPALVMAGVREHVKHQRWPTEFDHPLRKYTKHYFGAHFDWH